MLKYLFTALFKNGKLIRQTPEDLSSLNPAKSMFFDVLQEQDNNPCILFQLTDGINTFAVNLETGHFRSNSGLFYVGEPVVFYYPRVIYFRRKLLVFTQGTDQWNENITYFLGWQGNVTPDPKSGNIEKTISFT